MPLSKRGGYCGWRWQSPIDTRPGARSVVAPGGMVQVGLGCRPYFMAGQAMQRQLGLLQKYNTSRWT